jgi:hypothetical protein
MNAKVAVKFVESFQSGDVRRIFDNLIDPFDAFDHFVSENEQKFRFVINSITNYNSQHSAHTPKKKYHHHKLIEKHVNLNAD